MTGPSRLGRIGQEPMEAPETVEGETDCPVLDLSPRLLDSQAGGGARSRSSDDCPSSRYQRMRIDIGGIAGFWGAGKPVSILLEMRLTCRAAVQSDFDIGTVAVFVIPKIGGVQGLGRIWVACSPERLVG